MKILTKIPLDMQRVGRKIMMNVISLKKKPQTLVQLMKQALLVMMEVVVDQMEGIMEMTCLTVTKVALLLLLQKKWKYLVILQIKKHQNRKVVFQLNCRMNVQYQQQPIVLLEVCVRIFTASMLEDIYFIFHLGKNSESQALNMQSKQTNQLWYECQTFALERDKSSWDAGIIFAKRLSVLEMVIKFNFYAALCVISCSIL